MVTDRQIEKARASMPKWENGSPPVLTAEQRQLERELWCRDMINSILCYDGPQKLEGNRYLNKYVVELGAETVSRLCKEQIADFKKAVVLENVTIDSEGVSYNSVVWADQMVERAMELFEHDLAQAGPEFGAGYTIPDGKYHIYAYIDLIDDDKVIVLEPNKVVDGAHEPFVGDTYIVPFGNLDELRKGCDWCLTEFANDRELDNAKVVDRVISDARERSEMTDKGERDKDIEKE